jgi:hypothetical protein
MGSFNRVRRVRHSAFLFGLSGQSICDRVVDDSLQLLGFRRLMRSTAAAKGSSRGDLRAAFDTVSHSIAVYYHFVQAAILAVLSS